MQTHAQTSTHTHRRSHYKIRRHNTELIQIYSTRTHITLHTTRNQSTSRLGSLRFVNKVGCGPLLLISRPWWLRGHLLQRNPSRQDPWWHQVKGCLVPCGKLFIGCTAQANKSRQRQPWCAMFESIFVWLAVFMVGGMMRCVWSGGICMADKYGVHVCCAVPGVCMCERGVYGACGEVTSAF